MFAVTGVTGNTGSVVAQELLDAGKEVRVIVRNAEKGQVWKDKGADVVVADLTDLDALTQALTDIEAAYLMIPPDATSEQFVDSRKEIANNLYKAATAAKLPRAVLLSSVGAHLEAKTGPIITLRYLESLFKDSPVQTTALRPGYFLENWGAVLHPVLEENILPSFFEPLDLKIDMVATRDIGKLAAKNLLNPAPEDFKVIELKGNDQYSTLDIAAALSKALGKEITPVPVPAEAWVPTLTGIGLSADYSNLLAEMQGSINSTFIDFTDTNTVKGETELDTFIQGLVA